MQNQSLETIHLKLLSLPNLSRKTIFFLLIFRPHECKYCDFKTRKKGTLARHVEMKHEYDGSKFYCSTCGKSFKHFIYLKEHMMYVHEGKPRKKPDPKGRRKGTGQGARHPVKNNLPDSL